MKIDDQCAELGQNWLADRVADGTLSMAEAFKRARAAALIRAQGRLAIMRLRMRDER